MRGMMQDRPLLIATLIEHAAANHGDTEIVSRADGGMLRTTYAQAGRRAKQVAQALARLGVTQGERVATLAWNTHRHFELYFGISGSGIVCHTVNPRLFLEQIVFIINHAQDRIVFFDLSFVDLVKTLAPQCPSVEQWIALASPEDTPAGPGLPHVLSYEALIGAETGDFEWPVFDENTASSLCYTSGTTGDPKGVLYTHRSTVLHSYAATMPDCFNLSARDVVLPGSSMYHANAWGVVYAATLVGAKLVLPGQKLDGASLHETIEAEGVTVSFGVPTIWSGYVQHLENTGEKPSIFRRIVIGGAACPLALMQTAERKFGIEIVHLWGMTETSPLGTVNVPKSKHAGLDAAARDDLRSKQGRTVYGVELKIVDDEGRALPHDGVAFGDLLVRGWWIAGGYFGGNAPILRDDGWFDTGDVATVDGDGYMRITDRSKDVIKSGGEWISSIDLENAAMGWPQIAEAAVVGVPHPKWDERPLLIVVRRDDAALDRDGLMTYLQGKVAKWWLPDEVIVVDEIPHTATGKILKTQLRAEFGDRLTRKTDHAKETS